jgi:hypothetical protein
MGVSPPGHESVKKAHSTEELNKPQEESGQVVMTLGQQTKWVNPKIDMSTFLSGSLTAISLSSHLGL